MKTPMKIIIIVSVLVISLICIGGGILSMKSGYGTTGIVFAAVGGLGILAIGLWPIIGRGFKSMARAQNLGLSTLIVGSVLLYIVLVGALIYALVNQTVEAFFGLLNGVSLVTGMWLMVIFFMALLYWSFKKVEAREMGPRGAFGAFMLALVLIAWPLSAIMDKYSPKYAPGYSLWFALLAVILLILSIVVLISQSKQLALADKIKRCIWIMPYALFASAWTMLLGGATWTFLSGPHEVGLKILVGIFDTLYTLACALLPLGLAGWLGTQTDPKSAPSMQSI
jgi:hypothetical protein